jgi:triphosphatase
MFRASARDRHHLPQRDITLERTQFLPHELVKFNFHRRNRGAHQLHIGLRRLRSALRTLRPLVDRGSLRAFERSARNMGRSVGMLRDADVMISGIMAPMEAVASDKSGFAELHAALVRDRQDKRDEVRAALRSPAWTKLQLYLTLWPPTLEVGAEGPITKHARKVLRKAWKRPAELGKT